MTTPPAEPGLTENALTARRRALLEERLKGEGATDRRDTIRRSADSGGPAPLSTMQRRMWFLQSLMPLSAAYNIYTGLLLPDGVDEAALDRAVTELSRRHDSLRTVFRAGEDNEVYADVENRDVTLEHIAVGRVAPSDGPIRESLIRHATDEASRPFDLGAGPLFRAVLIGGSGPERLLLLTMHHIVADGASVQIIGEELHQLYEAFSRGREHALQPVSLQYADFVAWQRTRLDGSALQVQADYWRGKLSGELPVLELPADRPRPVMQTLRGARVSVRLGDELSRGLRELGRTTGATLPMTLLAGFQALLARITGQQDVLVGLPVAGRDRPELERVVGLFANTLVLRNEVDSRLTMRDLIGLTRTAALEAFSNHEVPFEQLVDEMAPQRDLSHNPLFQAAFAFQPADMEIRRLGAAAAENVILDNGTSKFDLTMYATELDDELEIEFEYSLDLFEAEKVSQLLQQLVRLLLSAVADPSAPVGLLSLLSDDETERILRWGQGEAVERSGPATLSELFVERARQCPDSVAVVDAGSGESLTYGELAHRSGVLAGVLRGLGVGPERLVGVCLPRTLDMVVAVLGVLRAGGGYVPLDPAFPQERLSLMVGDSAADVVVTQRSLVGLLPVGVRMVCVDEGVDWSGDSAVADVRADPDGVAYVIYTSGSTGRPKGVALTHRGAVTMLDWARSLTEPGDLDRVLASTSLCFDLSVYELFLPLYTGGTVVLAQTVMDVASGGPAADVTLINTVPSAAAQLVAANAVPESVRVVNLAGEQLPEGLVDRVYSRSSVRSLWNLYGPSEATTYSTYAPIPPNHRGLPPIGRPVNGTNTYIIDDNLQPVPVGVRGMLCLSGPGLARGYVGQAGLSAGVFLPDPFSAVPGARMYWTGDAARWRSDGQIEYLGRRDHQIKLNGFRIELGEIETALDRDPTVRQGVVAIRRNLAGRPLLVAYVEPTQSGIDTSQLLARLRASLPPYLIPGQVQVLDRLPLNSNGKVERRALPALVMDQPADEKRAPTNGAEQTLVDIWQEVIGGHEPIGIDDDFFQLGGDSILSIHVAARLNQAGLRVHARDIFQHRTVAALAKVVDTSTRTGVEKRPIRAPLNPMQQWLLAQELPNPHYWNQLCVWQSPGRLVSATLAAALRCLVTEHDALRLRFRQTGHRWVQEVSDDSAVSLRELDLNGLGEAEENAALREFAIACHRTLDISSGPVWCAGVVRRGDRPDLVLLVVHHLVVDAVSWAVIERDLGAAYEAISQGGEGKICPGTSSLTWANELHRLAESPRLDGELAWWLGALPEREPRLGVPLTAPSRTAAIAVTSRRLADDLTEAVLRQLPVVMEARTEEVLLAAFAAAVQQLTSGDALLVDLERHGRDEDLCPGHDLSRTVGWFTAQFPLFLRFGRGTMVLDVVRQAVRAVPGQGVGYGLLRYLSSHGSELANRPTARLRFNFLGQTESRRAGSRMLTEGPVVWALPQDPANPPAHLLDLDVYVADGLLNVVCTRDTRVSEAFTDRLLDRFESELQDMAGAVPETIRSAGVVRVDRDLSTGELEAAIGELAMLESGDDA
ncbi:amino acid adenylation domain-containing protein [Streptomyces sp. NPDC051218]|uniref:amino acid adenylation domain-containing protein n=1 Tax=Streptomyces sp. NPDC051218 TaxID=3365645 RepID=UPI00379A4178